MGLVTELVQEPTVVSRQQLAVLCEQKTLNAPFIFWGIFTFLHFIFYFYMSFYVFGAMHIGCGLKQKTYVTTFIIYW